VGPDYPIIMRMNGDDFLEGGITVDQAVEHAKLFADAGIDALDVSSGPFESHHWQFLTMYQPAGALVPAAAAIKKAVKIPVMTVGKIDARMAERILEEGSADFVQLARPLIVDPELPNKAAEGRWEDIRPCIYCDTCMKSLDASTCAVNPDFAKETHYKFERAAQAKKVTVVGGGLAGMEAARTLAERGHQVSLYEQSDRLGGQWNVLSAYRPDEANLVRYLSRQLEKNGVNVLLGQKATPQIVEQTKPDAVVVATGATPARLEGVPGIESEKVVMADDILSGRVEAGSEVVVVISGRGSRGLAAALSLAEQGKTVSVVSKNRIAWGLSHNIKLALLEQLIQRRVAMFPESVLESVTDKGVHILWDGGEPPEKGGPRYEVLFLKADTVVVAAGSKSENALGESLSGIMPEVYTIGDCVEPRGVLKAIHEGSAVGRKI
jgi:NADPH-dependent 2,4-dienoyl-CoA reductase/sulfur reductase-like enzyme